MTDRAKALVVHLDDDYRIGDGETGADRLIAAVEMLKGVTRVEPLVTTTADYLARERARFDLRERIRAVLSGEETT